VAEPRLAIASAAVASAVRPIAVPPYSRDERAEQASLRSAVQNSSGTRHARAACARTRGGAPRTGAACAPSFLDHAVASSVMPNVSGSMVRRTTGVGKAVQIVGVV